MERDEFGVPHLPEEHRAAIAEELDAEFSERLATGQPFLDALWDVYTEARDAEMVYSQAQVACHKGCSQCCEQTFLVSRVEFAAMIEAYDALDRTQQYKVSKRVQEMIRSWSRYLKRKAARGPFRVEDVDGFKRMLLELRDDCKVVCPFLSDAGSCLIYDARPFECRACLSAIECNNEGGKMVYSVCDFWPGGKLAEREMELYGEVATHPLPHHLMLCNRF